MSVVSVWTRKKKVRTALLHSNKGPTIHLSRVCESSSNYAYLARNGHALIPAFFVRMF